MLRKPWNISSGWNIVASPDNGGALLSLPGMALRKARTERGLSLEEVAARTCIPRHSLVALEADDYGRLPEAVYVRGYLRRCGALLGIDCERLLEDFELQYQEYTGAGEHEDPVRDARQSRVVLAGGAALGAVIAVVLIILLWPG